VELKEDSDDCEESVVPPPITGDCTTPTEGCLTGDTDTGDAGLTGAGASGVDGIVTSGGLTTADNPGTTTSGDAATAGKPIPISKQRTKMNIICLNIMYHLQSIEG